MELNSCETVDEVIRWCAESVTPDNEEEIITAALHRMGHLKSTLGVGAFLTGKTMLITTVGSDKLILQHAVMHFPYVLCSCGVLPYERKSRIVRLIVDNIFNSDERAAYKGMLECVALLPELIRSVLPIIRNEYDINLSSLCDELNDKQKRLLSGRCMSNNHYSIITRCNACYSSILDNYVVYFLTIYGL